MLTVNRKSERVVREVDMQDVVTSSAMRNFYAFANLLGFTTAEDLLRHSRLVVVPNIGLVSYLADLTMGNFPRSTYRIAFFDYYAEEHVQLFADNDDAFVWLAQSYSEFGVFQPDSWLNADREQA